MQRTVAKDPRSHKQTVSTMPSVCIEAQGRRGALESSQAYVEDPGLRLLPWAMDN